MIFIWRSGSVLDTIERGIISIHDLP